MIARRKPLLRGSSPRRTSRPPSHRKAGPRRGRVLDPEYPALVRQLPCAARFLNHQCADRIEAHHMGTRGLGQKADDRTAVPLCRRAHRAWHDCTGPFAGWPKVKRRAFAEESIARTQRAVEWVDGITESGVPF